MNSCGIKLSILCGLLFFIVNGLEPIYGEDALLKLKGGSVIVVTSALNNKFLAHASRTIGECLQEITGQSVQIWEGTRQALEYDGKEWKPIANWKYDEAALGNSVSVHIGPTEQCKAVLGKRVDGLDMDAFIIKTHKNAVLILGNTDHACEFGAYTFLEDFCNVRWYLPGEIGEEIPLNPDLAIPEIDKIYTPAYLHRLTSGIRGDEGEEWLRSNKFRTSWSRRRFSFHHNLDHVFDVKKYGKKYPDLYPILGGRRRIPAPGVRVAWQPCLTHPKAVEITMEYARNAFKNPLPVSISLGINDGGGYCECERCKARGTFADIYYAYVNEVAQRVAKEFPGRKIAFLGYGEAGNIPKGVQLGDNIVIFEVVQSLGCISESNRAKFDAHLEELRSHGPSLGLYNWYYGRSMAAPAIYQDAVTHFLRKGHEMGAVGSYTECYTDFRLDGLKYWVYGKLLWNPKLDGRKLWQNAIADYFKGAAKPMQAFYDLMEECTTGAGSHNKDGVPYVGRIFRTDDQLRPFTMDAVRKGEELLEQATRAVGSDEKLSRRVDYVRSAYGRTVIYASYYWAADTANRLLDEQGELGEIITALGQNGCYQRHSPGSSVLFGSYTKAMARTTQLLTKEFSDEMAKITKPQPADRDRILFSLEKKITEHTGSDAEKGELMQALLANARKIVFSRKCSTAPKIDGVLDDACWKTAEKGKDFCVRAKSARYRT